MPDYQAIYQNQAAQYDLMVSREDYQSNLLPALNAVRSLSGADVVELGAGTGNETPAPPTEGLAAFYQTLENEYGFALTALRTDYRFESPAEGQALLRFFFGDELADRIVAEQLTVLPECTGIWWRTLE